MTFSKEPVLWIGAIIAILQLIQNILVSGTDVAPSIITAVLTAIGAVISRRQVTPVDPMDK